MPANLRLLPTESLSGPENMAADEVMLLAAADRNIASLRFYTWSVPTLSLGYFQPAAPRLTDVVWVRRPSGGAAILHHHELTYCLALPIGAPWQTKESWICRFHHLVTAALATFGVLADSVVCGQEKKLGDFLCFLHQTAGDLLINDAKIAGSAQRKLRGALMQHGSILLKRSPHAPALEGIAELVENEIGVGELSDAIAREMRSDTKWEIQEASWTEDERRRAAEIAQSKYSSESWNLKR